MQINGIGRTQAGTTETTPTPAQTNRSERDSFMQLLLLQMKSQDPLSPMDTTAMFNQMAQLSMLEQLWDINEALTASSASQQLAQGSMLIGRHVEANSADQGKISGLVEQVRLVSGDVLLQIGSNEVRMDEIVSVQ